MHYSIEDVKLIPLLILVGLIALYVGPLDLLSEIQSKAIIKKSSKTKEEILSTIVN